MIGGKYSEKGTLFLDTSMLRVHYAAPPFIDKPSRMRNECVKFEIDPLLDVLQVSMRKYTRASLKNALDAILNKGVTVTQASYSFGIKRTSLQHYLKKLNIKIKF